MTTHARASAALPVIPVLAAAAVGVRMSFGPGLTVGLIVAVVLIPVWVPAMRRYRSLGWWMVIGVIAVVWGVLLTALDTSRETSSTVLLSESLTVLAAIGAVGVLLWVRQQAGVAVAAIAFCCGMLASVVLSEPAGADAWKFSWSVPIYLLVMSLAMLSGSRVVELSALAVLSLTTIITDSRSVTAFLLLSAALIVWQMRPGMRASRPRAWLNVAGLALVAASAYFLFQSLIFEGVLGEAARDRSLQQVATSGSLIAGGRPEMGASTSLILANPMGIGSGVLASANDVWVAKAGMAALNYDPNNGYVERYMFGNGFEVHSILGDMWLRFGLAGAVFALFLLILCVVGIARCLSLRRASALLIFTGVFTVWNTFFSPFLGSYRIAVLALLLVAVESAASSRDRKSSTLPVRWQAA